MFDISRIFKRIEEELIESMMRNLARHRAEETEEGFTWEQWQVIQLQEMERYRKENPEKFAEDFDDIEEKVEDALNQAYQDGQTEQEKTLLGRILDKIFPKREGDNGHAEGGFFGFNRRRLQAIIDHIKDSFRKGEAATLTKAADDYRQVIADAQVYAATGLTYEKAVDMAVKDLLKAGYTSIVYKNGARHTLEDYAEMALRTAQKRAYLMGEGEVRKRQGIHTVRVNKRQDACPKCVGFLGKVLVDDVYSGGSAEEARELGVPTLSEAMAAGLFHPNCKDMVSTYIPGVSKPADPWTKEEIEALVSIYNDEQKKKHAEDMAESYGRMAKYMLDPENKRKYRARADEWKEKAKSILSAGGGQEEDDSGTRVRHVADIDYSDKDAIMDLLHKAEEAFAGLDHEEAVIITSDGKVWYAKAKGGILSLEGITSRLLGAYAYHNHPLKYTRYSFGEEDVASFIGNGYAYSKASDLLYEYEMRRSAATKDAPFEELYHRHKVMQNLDGLEAVLKAGGDPDIDKFDEIMKLLSEEYGFEYTRTKKTE